MGWFNHQPASVFVGIFGSFFSLPIKAVLPKVNLQGRLDPHILISYEDLRFEKCNLPGGVFGKVPAESEVTRVFPGRFEINGFFLGGQKGARRARAV